MSLELSKTTSKRATKLAEEESEKSENARAAATIQVSRQKTNERRWEYVLVFEDTDSEKLNRLAQQKENEILEQARHRTSTFSSRVTRSRTLSLASQDSSTKDSSKDDDDDNKDVETGKSAPLQETRRKNFRAIVKSLSDANIDLRLERFEDYIYCSIRLRTKTLQKYADKNEIVVPLVSSEVKKIAKVGIAEKNIAPFPIRHNPDECKIRPFDYIYGKYDMSPCLTPIYGEFSPLVHNQLTLSILEGLAASFGVTQQNQDDASITDLSDLIKDPQVPLVAYFPLHDKKLSKTFEAKFLRWTTRPWDIPLDGVRNYFGEKIGFYFMFLAHLTTWQIPFAVLGVIAFGFEIELWIRNGVFDPDTYFVPAFCSCTALWAVLWIEFLKRKQSRKALEWGVSDFSKQERARQEFEGTVTTSLVTGREEIFFSPYEKRKRLTSSILFVSFLIIIVVSAIIGVYVVQHILEEDDSWSEYASMVSGILLALQIQVFNVIYRYVAIKLTNFENHKTDSQFETALVFKVFIFQVINSYASLAYIAFFKTEEDCIDSCMRELQSSLMSIFLVGLFVSNFVETAVPAIVNALQRCWASRSSEHKYTDVETAFLVLDQYDSFLGQLDDYGELLIQFGYLSMFSVCFPLAPFLALCTCWIEIRSDGYKLLRVCRRPEPLGAEDIGPWNQVVSYMARLGLVTNAAIVCFTSKFLRDDPIDLELKYRMYIFIGYLVAMSLFLALIDVAIPDVSTSVQVQIQRMNFIRQKVIDRTPDKIYDFRRSSNGSVTSLWAMPPIREGRAGSG